MPHLNTMKQDYGYYPYLLKANIIYVPLSGCELEPKENWRTESDGFHLSAWSGKILENINDFKQNETKSKLQYHT